MGQRRLRLGVAALDESLGGGVGLAALHEIRACESRDGGAAAGFALALIAWLAQAAAPLSLVWISEADSRREAGSLYGPGLLAFGLDPAGIVEVAARTPAEALWAFETALACRDIGAAVCEMRRVSLPLTATRRCALRAREAGVTGLLLRQGGEAEPTAAELRFRLASAPAGCIGSYEKGVGRAAWRLALEKNRGGRTGAFTLEWNAHERCFAERARGEGSAAGKRAHPQSLSAPPVHRPSAPDPGEPAAGIRIGSAGRLRRVS